MSYKVTVVIKKDKDGYYACCPELEGCQTQAETFEKITASIREAIELYIETLPTDKRKSYLNQEIYTTTIEVQVD